MTHVDCDKFPRDCGNCAHSVRRHMPDNPIQNTLVCLRNACGVRPNQLKATQHTPCGTAIDVIDGLVPRYWKRGERVTIYERLFGTPERAAEQLDEIDACDWMRGIHGDGALPPERCVGCLYEYDPYICERKDMTLLEWLRQEVEA